ncbi:hypothetical protein DYS74_10015 [Sinirhodobacter hankyongi]|uniref:Lipoprotein n=2 Tax=Paenirhodobacter hankyongi TaxID=2294033 RepID=A0A421BNK9_9RHOB|nr:hypothetical protein DYS74_10015 [Sinirhodobacter hankyongi]
MKRRAFVLLALLPLAACGGKNGEMQFYPIAGPIADADSSIVIAAKATNIDTSSGQLYFRLPKPKLKCEGTWSSVTPKVTSHERGLSLTIRDTGGKYKNATEDVGGVNRGEIYAVCEDGTRIQGSFIQGSGTKSGTGTATDTLGNSYKLLF